MVPKTIPAVLCIKISSNSRNFLGGLIGLVYTTISSGSAEQSRRSARCLQETIRAIRETPWSVSLYRSRVNVRINRPRHPRAHAIRHRVVYSNSTVHLRIMSSVKRKNIMNPKLKSKANKAIERELHRKHQL